jgi:hypothetical protein
MLTHYCCLRTVDGQDPRGDCSLIVKSEDEIVTVAQADTAVSRNTSTLPTLEKLELTIEAVASVEVFSLYSGRNFLGGFEFVVLGAGAGFLGTAHLTRFLRFL